MDSNKSARMVYIVLNGFDLKLDNKKKVLKIGERPPAAATVPATVSSGFRSGSVRVPFGFRSGSVRVPSRFRRSSGGRCVPEQPSVAKLITN